MIPIGPDRGRSLLERSADWYLMIFLGVIWNTYYEINLQVKMPV